MVILTFGTCKKVCIRRELEGHMSGRERTSERPDRHLNLGKFGSIPLKDHHFRSIPLLSHLHVGPHESMTCGVHGIYLKFGSFNGIDPIVP
jgi:hypothetical protein